ncbi:MAG TPA: hypothetical protein VL128_06885 [Candidatus Eisenbacteria bacterium]|nr:hypothetical protein [Candidatus Eisenbacteria bacterium]
MELQFLTNRLTFRRAFFLVAALSLAAAAPAQDPGPLPNPPSPRTQAPPPPRRQPQQATQTPQTYHTAPPPQAIHSPGDSPILNTPPSMPVDEIIKHFSERESEFKLERGNYTYTQSFSIQTIDDDNRPDGEYRMTSDIVFTPDGKRYEKVTYAPVSTLQRIQISEQDLDDVRNVQPFVLTTEDLPKYNVTYVGKQQVDELSCYVFDVAPKVIEKKQRYFQGRVWVDDKDLQVVMSDGKAVPDIINKNNENVFPRFRTYRQNIEKGYWFPVYTRADDFLHFSSGDVHIRMTIRYSNYKRYGSTVKMGQATEIKNQH